MGELSLLAILFATSCFASDSFVGTWKANGAKMKLSAGSPESRRLETLSIDDMGPNQYRVTRTTPDGKNNSAYGLTFDGRERQGDGGSSAIGIRVDQRHLRNTLKGPKGTLVSDWIISADGKQLTNNRKGNGTETGRPIDEVLIYVKIADL